MMERLLKAWGWWLAGVLSLALVGYFYGRRFFADGAELELDQD